MTDRPVRSGTRTRLFAGAALLVVIVIAAIIAVVLFTGEKDFVVEGGYQVIGDAVSKKILAGESSTLSHEDGARIEVPKGAITDSATLVIAEVEPPISTLAVPFAYDFSVAGADLLNPVTVYIPIEPGWANQPSNIHALHWSDEFEDWEPVAGKVDESLLTIAVTTDDLSLFTAVFVKVEATCNVDPTTAQTGRNGQSITFSSMVRAIETPLNSDINVYMRPSFIDYTRGTVSSEVVGDPFRTETRTLTEGGSSVTFSYSSKTDYSGYHDFKCRLFWEFPGDIPDNELEPDSVVAVAFDITGSGTYFGYEGLSYDGSRLKSCGPSSTPLLGESVPLKVIGHGVNRDKGFKTYFVAAVKIYEDSELIHLEFGKRPTDSFTNAIPIVDTTYTFPSDGHYTMDCELWWHAGDPHIPTGTLEEKAKSIGRCVFSSSFCVGGVKALRGVLTRTFDITSARWAAEGVRVSPSLLPNEGGEITVTVHSESSTGVQISAPTISIASLGFQLPANSCGTTDLGSYVSRCWQASFNGANKIPANNSSQGVSYQVTASSVSIPGGNQTTSVTVGAPPPPPIVQPPPPTDASDREALIALYDATRGEIWYNNSQGNEVWDVDEVNSDISSWHGVTVNSAGRVTGLDLYRNSLRYDRDHRNSLPPELGNLAYLWSLVLSDNDLRGRIPDAFGNLGNLVELLLDDNSLSGNIPASLGNLTSLESLDLSNNNLSGEIPPGLGSLPRMDVVYLGGNNLSGCVPAEWRRVQGDPDELGLPFCDVALNDLTVSPGRLSPEFEVSESSYTVEIPAYETTITPANYQGASFQFLDAGGNVLTDADAARPGHQVQLTAATTTVRILVTSRDGEEDASYTIEISRSPGAPGAPVINPATPGPATLALSWSAPSNTGTSPISSYSLRYRVAGPGGGGASAPWMVVQSIWNPSLGGLSYDLTGLQPSVRYELQMRAVNNSGPGPWSATATGATVSALPPGMPLNSTAAPAGQTGIRLSWGRPSSDGGSPITGYRIQASEDGSTWATLVANARPGVLTYSHTALFAGSTWHYRVAAINSVGLGTWSNVATASTASPGTPQVPGPPVNPAATPEGTTSIQLTWGPPASSGSSAVSGFQLEVSEDGGRWSPLAAVGPLTTSYSHTGLSPQSARRYRVAAANAAGLGAWSVVFSATTEPEPELQPLGPAFAHNLASIVHHPDRDITGRLGSPWGLWSDGATLWWMHPRGTIYAHNLATGAREESKDIGTPATVGNIDPRGIWSDGRTIWVADWRDHRIYAYDLANKQRVTGKELTALGPSGNHRPEGIWSDGVTMWVTDLDDDKLYAYDMNTGEHVPERDFDTLINSGSASGYGPRGLWSDHNTMWVANVPDGNIYAYDMVTKQRVPSKDLSSALRAVGNDAPWGLWSDGSTFWVTDHQDRKIYAYTMPPDTAIEPTASGIAALAGNAFARNPELEFNFTADNDGSEGIWSDGHTIWVADRFDHKIYAYNVETKLRDAEKEFDTLSEAGNHHPVDIWSDGNTVWVADYDDRKIYGYNLRTKHRDSSKDFPLLTGGNNTPQGIWSNGTTMWVTDNSGSYIYAYSMTTKQPDERQEFNTLADAGNDNPESLWSDGATMWVADWNDGKIYAYSLATKQRDSTKDIDSLGEAGNDNPLGLWSDGITMWVSDAVDRRFYVYNLPPK